MRALVATASLQTKLKIWTLVITGTGLGDCDTLYCLLTVLYREQVAEGSMFLWPLTGDSLEKSIALQCVLSPARNQQLWWLLLQFTLQLCRLGYAVVLLNLKVAMGLLGLVIVLCACCFEIQLYDCCQDCYVKA